MHTKSVRWQLTLAIVLLATSTFIYLIHFAIFRDSRQIFLYLIQDIAFLPVQVLLVTLIIERLLTYMERRSIMNKMNMVIGAFFSEVGRDLLRQLAQFHTALPGMSQLLRVDAKWPDSEFIATATRISTMECKMDSNMASIAEIRDFLIARRTFLVALLENSNVLEHETFTDMLWAVFHLADELCHRERLEGLPQSDLEHLSGDMKRAYTALTKEWLMYMMHLKNDYPYLFSLAVRTNPFDKTASVEVK